MSITPPLYRIADAYGTTPNTLKAWMRRGITVDDLMNPATLYCKLLKTAKNDSPRLAQLRNKEAVGHIAFRLALIQ